MTTVRITDAGGNKPTFVQWDVDRALYVSGVASQPCLHFANAELKRAIVVQAEEVNGKWECKVPNFILQFALPVIVSVFTQPDGGEGRTEATTVIGVQPKKKPQDYDYTENIGYINWVNLTAEIQRMLDDGELNGDPGPKGDPPTVDTEITYYGNKVTFTGSNGPKTINVLDGMTDAVKDALLDLFEHVAYIDGNGQQYYDALYDAFNPVLNVDYITVVFDPGTSVIYNTYELAQLRPYITCTAHYDDGTSAEVDTYTLSGTLATGTSAITATYGGKSAIFTVTVVDWLVSISAVFTQGDNVFCTVDSLDALTQYLVVTATYADSTSAAVSDYTMSGTLTAGTSEIAVSYGGKTDTFVVTDVRTASKLFTNVVWHPFGASDTYSTSGSADGTLVATFNTTASTTNYSTGVGVDSTTSDSALKTYGNIKGHRVRCYYASEWISGGNSESNFTVSCYIGGLAYTGTRKKYATFKSVKNTTTDGFNDVLVPASADDFTSPPWGGTDTVTDSDYFSVRHYWLTSVAGKAKFTITVYDLGAET